MSHTPHSIEVTKTVEIVDAEWPENIEDALGHLVEHLEHLAAENRALAR